MQAFRIFALRFTADIICRTTKKRMNVFIILGTRPEAIKLAPVIHALKEHPHFTVTVCATGQHIQMMKQALGIFGIEPDIDLAIMKPGQDLYDITTNVLLALKPIFTESKPDIVLVQGDTTTTFAGALAAYYKQIPVGHVEAGLRTFRKYAPFPEEVNRILTGHIADIHFAPTQRSQQNLLQENVSQSTIHVTGNTAIDALHWILNKLNNLDSSTLRLAVQLPEQIFQLVNTTAKKVILVTGHRRENFGDGFEHICSALHQLSLRSDVEIIYPVHLNPNVREPVMRVLSQRENIHLLEPLDYASFAYLMNKSSFIITDSGGVQEEAPSLGKPVLCMRDVTERPEAIEAGTVLLVGTSQEKIVHEATKLLDDEAHYNSMAFAHNPYGDGKAAQRIRDLLIEFSSSSQQSLQELLQKFSASQAAPRNT